MQDEKEYCISKIYLNGSIISPSTFISANYTWGDALDGFNKIPNDPEVILNIKKTAYALELIQLDFQRKFKILSWFDGSRDKSYRALGVSVNLFAPGENMLDFYKHLYHDFPGGLGYYPGHNH